MATRGELGCTDLRGQNLPGTEVGKEMANVRNLGEPAWQRYRGSLAGVD